MLWKQFFRKRVVEDSMTGLEFRENGTGRNRLVVVLNRSSTDRCDHTHLRRAQPNNHDQLKSGELPLPHVERLDQIAPFIAKIRIAKGVSQTELARRLGVSKQVISRYEESDYQTVSIARLQEILDAIGIKTLVTLSA
jgi:ribosome-binding protein aMBF1 (putative translation factor)